MNLKEFAQRVLVLILLVALALMVFQIKNILLLLFASILMAVLIRAVVDFIRARTRLGEGLSFALALLFTIGLIAGFSVLFGLQIGKQLQDLIEILPKGMEQISERFEIDLTWNEIRNAVGASEASDILKKVSTYGLTTFNMLTDLMLVLVAAIFLAADPAAYRDGALLVVPPRARKNLGETMDAVGQALTKWFGGQLLEMGAVFLMSAVAYWLLGLPSALALAVIAGVTNFIPMLGPIIGGLAAVMVAATLGASTLLWTGVAVLVIQQIESHLLMPFIQRYAVSIPPALVIFSILGFSALFGVAGVILGVPLAVALTVVVQNLWVNETLGEDVPLAGSDEEKSSA
ncbi:MAG: AI-2E family transporter [Candidatus Competibacteraceae bacterium]|nr:AI-2E family transporter [Candidatus Competibacteraceae bacterium]